METDPQVTSLVDQISRASTLAYRHEHAKNRLLTARDMLDDLFEANDVDSHVSLSAKRILTALISIESEASIAHHYTVESLAEQLTELVDSL